jgi:hypothetical protein
MILFLLSVLKDRIYRSNVYACLSLYGLLISKAHLIQLLPHLKTQKKYIYIYITGWATGLSAGEADWDLEFAFFKVIVDLTDAGHG